MTSDQAVCVQNEAQQRRIHNLQAELEQQRTATAASRAADADLRDAQQRASSLEAAASSADERVALADAEASRLREAVDAKATEQQRLELAMGELAYEAESARGAQLRCRQLEVCIIWAHVCTGALIHAVLPQHSGFRPTR